MPVGHEQNRWRGWVAGLAVAGLFVALPVPVPTPGGASVASATTTYQPLGPVRLFDTRDGTGGVPIGRIGTGEVLSIQVTGVHGVGDAAAAVMVNLTVTQPTAAGFITAYPCNQPRPTVSSVSFGPFQTIANAALVPVAPDGTVCFFAESATHLVADLAGWFPDSMSGFGTVTPARVFDTRSGLGGVPVGKMETGGTLSVAATGIHGVPVGATAVSLTVTATGATGPGFITVHPCHVARSTVSNLNYTATAAVANAVIAPVAPDGTVCFFAETATNLIGDVNGWFGPGGAYTAVTPNRLIDTRQTPWPITNLSDAPTPMPLVTNGSATTIEAVPWQARVVIGGSIGCGGALIHIRWVVTAAHCLVNDQGEAASASSVRVWTGQTFQSSMTQAVSNTVTTVIVHPGFESSTFVNDIALLELTSPAKGGTPIHLYEDTAGPAALTESLISGWGETAHLSTTPNQLQSATLYVRAGPTGPCGLWGAFYVSSIMLCASGGLDAPDGAGGCRGDSGGPLMIQVGVFPRLAGVVSFGSVGCPNTHSAPTVFTRVSSYVSWIRWYAPAPGQVVDPDTLVVPVTNRAGVPAVGVGAVVLNVTSTGTQSPGFVTVYPCGTLPLASNLNTVPGKAVPNLVVAPVSALGDVCLHSPTATHLIVDVFGWLAA